MWQALGQPAKAAYLGNETARAESHGLAANPKPLTARLDWLRSYKDDYEVRSIEEATAAGARGHRAAREAFAAGASELEIHQAFCRAAASTEAELPYATIVALDEKAATLHYESKRHAQAAAACCCSTPGPESRGYACDITRTTPGRACDPRFVELVESVDAIEQDLVRAATPGRPYLEVHLQAHASVARVLSDMRILRVSAEEAFVKGYTHPFFPHGVGHHLGIQVHDVAGKQSDASGTPAPPPKEHPYLRNTRTIEAGTRVHDRAGHLLHPDAAAPLPLGDRGERLRLGEDRRAHAARRGARRGQRARHRARPAQPDPRAARRLRPRLSGPRPP